MFPFNFLLSERYYFIFNIWFKLHETIVLIHICIEIPWVHFIFILQICQLILSISLIIGSWVFIIIATFLLILDHYRIQMIGHKLTRSISKFNIWWCPRRCRHVSIFNLIQQLLLIWLLIFIQCVIEVF
jgi:hypothetical protein